MPADCTYEACHPLVALITLAAALQYVGVRANKARLSPSHVPLSVLCAVVMWASAPPQPSPSSHPSCFTSCPVLLR